MEPKRIVWLFGDGSVQFTEVHPGLLLEGETEASLIERMIEWIGPTLRVSPVKPDLTIRTEAERVVYEAALGSGAKATFAGVISGDEYERMVLEARAYREAWTWTTPAPVIDIDMTKARDIHRHGLRRLRKPRMEVLDVAYMRADEIGDAAEKQRIAALKQKLRDVTADQGIEAAKSVVELRAVIPPALKGV